MLQAIAGNTARDDSSPFRQKIPQQANILEINRGFIDTKPARFTALKKPTAAPSAVPTISSFHDRLRLLQLFVFV
ncbi:MAG: hypothetical protein LZF62_430087 [Nitrospira sp.]|nr:MAG: hypothetical protein LZF62_430087 [Nitrospira sp.]